MKVKIIFFGISSFVILVLIVLNVSVANPTNGILYGFKRIYEKTELSLHSNPKNKLDYQYGLADKRLAELTFVVENSASQDILSSSLRYSTTIGEITNLIIGNNLVNESSIAIDKFKSHLSLVENLPQKYTGDNAETKFLIDDTNYLKTYIGLLSSFENDRR